jgi:hypothetical protein
LDEIKQWQRQNGGRQNETTRRQNNTEGRHNTREINPNKVYNKRQSLTKKEGKT